MIHFSLWLNFAWFSLETPTEVSGLRQSLWTHWAVNKVTEGHAQSKFCRLSDLKEKQPDKNQSSGHRGLLEVVLFGQAFLSSFSNFYRSCHAAGPM